MTDPGSRSGSSDPSGGAGDLDRHRDALNAILEREAMTLEELWLQYFSLGGNADLIEVEAYLEGLYVLAPLERDMLAHAANEQLEELAAQLRVPYGHSLSDPLPVQGPLTSLVGLLDASASVLSGHLADEADAAGRALGVEVVVYLVDYQQQHLVAVTCGDETRRPLPIEGTLPGRAYQTAVTHPATTDPQPRLWVPLVDGAERLGVLDVMLRSSLDLADSRLRQHCEWFARLLAHLVTEVARQGDSVDEVRRTRDRSPAAELIWSLLPPMSSGAGRMTVAGAVEPAYEVGGDIFDYAVGDERASVAIFDAMGHELAAGLIAAAALGAYRSARRSGGSLGAQAATIDEVLDQNFVEGFATGVLSEIDLRTGRMSYLVAGHPQPLILRNGKVVIALDEGRRTPFRISANAVAPGEISLEPGDWLVFYTDGITEARDAYGDFFGQQRLVDLLEREAAGAHPPAETVRRLTTAVLRHQHGKLQDDATVVLARWAPTGWSPASLDLLDGPGWPTGPGKPLQR